jgi:hypothetical protein
MEQNCLRAKRKLTVCFDRKPPHSGVSFVIALTTMLLAGTFVPFILVESACFKQFGFNPNRTHPYTTARRGMRLLTTA